MRIQNRIPIVLDKINWSNFITDNTHIKEDSEILPKLVQRIIENISNIRKQWLYNPNLRLGQLLINEGYLPYYIKLNLCEEDDWLIKNGYCNIEDIKFWGNNVDVNGNILNETKYILLKDLELSHIMAIIDYFKEKNKKINPDYLKYFKSRIK